MVWRLNPADLVLILPILISLFSFRSQHGVEGNIQECSSPHENLKLTAPNSKYLYSDGMKPMAFPDFRQECTRLNLEPAEIRSQEDLTHLENFFSKNIFYGQWGLGAHDEGSGIFKESDGITPIHYQVFEKDPKEGQSCVALKKKFDEDLRWVMNPMSCNTPVSVLCQFSKTSSCNINSPQSAARKSENMAFVGSSTDRSYFVGTRQSLWGEAGTKCVSSWSKLLDLAVDGREGQDLIKMLRSWLQQQGLHRDTAFWTSGKETDDPIKGLFSWRTTETNFDPDNTTIEWKWDENEPVSSSSSETCITFRIPDIYQRGVNPFVFRLANCKLPHYFVCYKDISLKLNEVLPEDLEFDTEEDKQVKQPCFITEVPTVEINEPGFTAKDVMTLALLNANNDLRRGNVEIQLPAGSDWKREFVNILVEITKNTCPNEYVPQGFMNVMKNLILVYIQNTKSESVKNTDQDMWDKITSQLSQCLINIQEPMNMTSSGNMAFSVDEHEVSVNAETVDRSIYPPLDFVIETFWFMFELSIGTCYPMFKSKTDWLVDYYFNFKSEYINDMINRWMLASYNTDINFGSIIGDFDITSALYNLRICSTASHMKNDIPDRLIARPIFVNIDNREFPNEKTMGELSMKIY